MNQADLFRAALRVPYMRTRRYHDADMRHLATLGERLADDYDRLAKEHHLQGVLIDAHLRELDEAS